MSCTCVCVHKRGIFQILKEVPVLQRELEYPRPTPYRSNLLLHHAIESKIKLRKGGYAGSHVKCQYFRESWNIQDPHPIDRIYYYIMLSHRTRLNLEREDIPDLKCQYFRESWNIRPRKQQEKKKKKDKREKHA